MKILSTKVRRKLREWVGRYAWLEIVGTITALSAAWVTLRMTDSLALSAIAGTIGENIGYYGTAFVREVAHYWEEHHHHARLRRLWLTGVKTIRDMIVEFGAAEVLDSFLIRPGLFYLIPATFGGNYTLDIFIAKILADLVFYGFAIIGYEVRKKFFPPSNTTKNKK